MKEFFDGDNEETAEWGPIADLMTALMLIFLFVAVLYMRSVSKEKEKIREIAVSYNQLQNDLYKDLKNEFESDLSKWDASIDKQTLSVKFKAPDVLFEVGKADLQNKFKEILDDFFPRYIKILMQEKYKNDIEEIRIEGHTSSEWFNKVSESQAYI